MTQKPPRSIFLPLLVLTVLGGVALAACTIPVRECGECFQGGPYYEAMGSWISREAYLKLEWDGVPCPGCDDEGEVPLINLRTFRE